MGDTNTTRLIMPIVKRPITEEGIQLARERMVEAWSGAYEELQGAKDFEAVIMDEANDLAEFTLNSDTRTSVILLVSFLEDTLKNTFVEYWDIKSRRDIDRFFGANGPLATFSQRVLVAKGLNWISDEKLKEIDALRKLRNVFAHNHRIHSLSGSEIKKLILPLDKIEQTWSPLEDYNSALKSAPEEIVLRLRIFCSGVYCAMSILNRAKLAKAEIPVGFRPNNGWTAMLEVEQGLIDAVMRHCWKSLGLEYSGPIYEYGSGDSGQTVFRKYQAKSLPN